MMSRDPFEWASASRCGREYAREQPVWRATNEGCGGSRLRVHGGHGARTHRWAGTHPGKRRGTTRAEPIAETPPRFWLAAFLGARLGGEEEVGEMCTVSMVADHWREKWMPQPDTPAPSVGWIFTGTGPTREEFDALRREVEDLRKLLQRAKAYDEEHGEPGCETDEKMDLLQRIAKAVGVDLEGAP